MSKGEDISVIMATYNGAAYIREQLASLAAQTLLPRELIISDDGSTDGTIEIVKEFSSSAPFPVKFKVNSERLGYSGNFFSAAENASSRYIAFCDQDDVWLDTKLKICAEAISEHEPLLCVHMATLIDSQSKQIGVLQNGHNKPGIFGPLSQAPWVTFVGFTMVFDTVLLRIISPSLRGRSYWGEDLPLAHDSWIYLLASSLGKTVVLPHTLAHYRQHGYNASGLSPKSLISKFSLKIGPVASSNLRRSFIAAEFSRVFGRIPPQVWDAGTTTAASNRWSKVSAIEREREALYQEAPLGRRFMHLVKVFAEGGYRSYKDGGLGLWILIKDAAIGLLRLRKVKM